MIFEILEALAAPSIAMVVLYAGYCLNSRRNANCKGDLKLTFGGANWVAFIFGLLLFGFMCGFLYHGGLKGPDKDAWIFWGIVVLSFGFFGVMFAALVFSLFFPLTLKDDVIHYTTLKFQEKSKPISMIDYAHEDKHGTVTFEFSDGEELKISRYFGGTEAILQHIYDAMLKLRREEMSSTQGSFH